MENDPVATALGSVTFLDQTLMNSANILLDRLEYVTTLNHRH